MFGERWSSVLGQPGWARREKQRLPEEQPGCRDRRGQSAEHWMALRVAVGGGGAADRSGEGLQPQGDSPGGAPPQAELAFESC